MVIALMADDKKKELMAQFCIAYCGILSKHHISATGTTAKYVSDATGLEIDTLLSGDHGGSQQIASRVSYDEIDLLIMFRDANPQTAFTETDNNILRLCDIHNVPLATNIASAEILVRALERGDLDWREIINPTSDYNKRKKSMFN